MKFFTSAWMVLITLLILTTVRWWDPGPVQRLRLMNFDGYQHLLSETTSDKIVLHDIGEEFLKEHGQWPPKRTVEKKWRNRAETTDTIELNGITYQIDGESLAFMCDLVDAQVHHYADGTWEIIEILGKHQE